MRDLPGLSRDQIKKIGDTDHLLRTRHMQIEAELSPEERDHARVCTFVSSHCFGLPSQPNIPSHPIHHTRPVCHTEEAHDLQKQAARVA